MCVLPNAPTALINKHPNENLARLELLKKKTSSHVDMVNTPSSSQYYYYYLICDVDRLRSSKSILGTKLDRNKSEE